jgi:rhodanese-related sulfurtransferase
VVPVKEVVRLSILLASSTGLAFGVNILSARPVPVLNGADAARRPAKAARMTIKALREAWKAGQSVALLDVRSARDYRAGHPARALHAPAEQFQERYWSQGLGTALKAADRIVVLCSSERCPAGDQVAELLKGLGHPAVQVLEGGWEVYETSGLEIVRP